MSGEITLHKILGTVRRWRVGDVYYAKNNLITMAYMVNSDRAGAIGTSGPGDDAVFNSSPPIKQSFGMVRQIRNQHDRRASKETDDRNRQFGYGQDQPL